MCLGPREPTPPLPHDLLIHCYCVWLKPKIVTQATSVSLEREEQPGIRKCSNSLEGSWFRTYESFWSAQEVQVTSTPHLNKMHIYATTRNKVMTCQSSSSSFSIRPSGDAPNFRIIFWVRDLPVQWRPQVRPHQQMEPNNLLTVYSILWDLGPKCRAGKTWVEPAREAEATKACVSRLAGLWQRNPLLLAILPSVPGVTSHMLPLVFLGSPGQFCFLSSFMPHLWMLLKALGIFRRPKPVKIGAQCSSPVKPEAGCSTAQEPCSSPLSACHEFLSQGSLGHLSLPSLRRTPISGSRIPSFFHMLVFAQVVIWPPSFPVPTLPFLRDVPKDPLGDNK